MVNIFKESRVQACVSKNTRKLYGSEKPFVKLRPPYSGKLVFSYVDKGIKMKITAKFRDTEQLSFWKMRTTSPEKFRDFRETGPRSGAKLVTWWYWVKYCATPRPWRNVKGFAWYWGEFSESGKDEKIHFTNSPEWSSNLKGGSQLRMIYDIYRRTCLVFQQTRIIVWY